METLNFEQMEQVNGEGFWGAVGCGALFIGWGAVMAAGFAATGGAASAAVVIATEAAWNLVGVGVCGAVFS